MNNIDLTLLHSNSVKEININEKVNFPKEIYENSSIQKLKDIQVEGVIKRLNNDDDFIDLTVNGVMILLDSISLEEVDYPFSFKIEGNLIEILGKCPNSLDILELLWENIVLEIPIKFTKITDLSKFSGNGWKLVSEDETHKNNPFSDLLEEYREE